MSETDERKVLTTAVPAWVADKLRDHAATEKRSVTKQLELILTEYAREHL